MTRKLKKSVRAKEKWMNDQRAELEELEKKDIQIMNSKIKKMSKHSSKPANTALKDNNNNIVFEKELILKRWTEYIGELFNDERDDMCHQQMCHANN